ncbi:glucose dehydrogenase [FAD, quinone]-like isoform X2 [Prorops nasuta]|uniref:glucose dehydrogenase [FAD, quinone]-like isoform X2 n=1 Tax=Prorops nasuta TaxID=863751 RepID=UPI0034CFE660
MLKVFNFFSGFISSVTVIIFFHYINTLYELDIYKHKLMQNIPDLKEYDFIIVGAGSAGSIIAARLSDDGNNVLLVEAGGEAIPFIDIPLLTPLLQKTQIDWQYVTVPQEHACKSLVNNQSHWPMGKILGGTSRLNNMVYFLGHSLDFNSWFADYEEPIVDKGGFINLSYLKWNTPLADAVLKGIEEMSLEINNINCNLKAGFMKVQLTMENGKRWSTDQVLHERYNKTLNIITHAYVTKITVIKDLPVGQQLVDHILTGIDLVTLNTSLPLSIGNVFNPKAAFEYFFMGQGPWTSSGIEVVGTFHSSLQNNNLTAPDLQIMVMPSGISQDNDLMLRKAMGLSDEVYKEYFLPLAEKNAISITPVLLHPSSFGEVKLSSSNPFDKPIIDPKYLSNKKDILTLIDGLQFVKKLIKTRPMIELGASLYKKKFPGCENQVFDSQEYWECYVRHLTLTSYHPAGTCRMGKVVDPFFRVYDVSNLYIVDASVLPILPSGNIQAAIIMLAEKAALQLKNVIMELNIPPRSLQICYIFNMCDYNNICVA